ncbi:MAG TPA: ion channel [bacterium]|nr:ion channel [bacterium]
MSVVATTAATTAGVVILLGISYDLFQTVLLPRPAVRKLQFARVIVRPLWGVWRWFGLRSSRLDRSEARLAAFGPLSLLLIFAIWGTGLVLGYGLIIHGVRDQFRPNLQDFSTALYVSASTLVPLAYGDFVPEHGGARMLIVMESANGVVLAALAITVLFELYGAFRSREEPVVALEALAGAPASAVQLLETSAEPGMAEALKETFDEWRRWSAMVLESHLAYPLLAYFRSSHDNEAWINSFGAVMDAAALVISSVEVESAGAARLMFTVGSHLVEDMAIVFGLTAAADPIIERSEYMAAVGRLRAAGYRVKDGDTHWQRFADLRSRYGSMLNQAAQFLAIPPAPWVGDRSYLPHRQRGRRRKPATNTAC